MDSLTVLLGKSKEDTTKVTLLNLLAIEMIGVSPDSAFKYVDLAFDLAESLGSDLKIAQCYNITGNIYRGKFEYDKALDLHWEVLEMYRDLGENLGWSFLEIGSDHYWMNNFDTARQYFNEAAIEFRESNNDNGRAISLNNIGMVDQVQGNYLEALRLFVKAAEIFEQMGRVNGIAWSYELIADVYYQEGNSDKALDYLLKSKKIYGKMRDTRGLMKAYLKLGPIYSSLGDRTEALNNYSLAMQFGEDLGDMISVAIANNKMGEIYVDKREYERALRYRRSALEIQESIGDELNMSITLNGIGEIYIKMGNSAAAIQHLDRSVETAQKIGYKNILKSSYRLLASAHQLKEDYKKAFQYQVMYTELSDEVYNEKRMQKILELQAKYEDKKDQEEIKLLTKENRIQELEARRDGIFNYSLFIGMILSTLLGLVIFNRNRIKQKALRDLKSINDEMEDAIEARTKEVIVQKEEIEKTYKDTKLLSSIGKSITACLSVEKIIEAAYERVNEMMAASSLAIGIYNEELNSLEFPGVIEKGKVLPFFDVKLDQEDQMPVVCFKDKQAILINDMSTEAKDYIGIDPDDIALEGEKVSALIYLPLYIKKQVIGVVSVQSFRKNVYTTYNLDMLRSLAIYVGIALENARGYEQIEEKVKERTAEVLEQKQAIEKAYQDVELLSGIGKDVTSTLSVEEIVGKVYKNVNALMDASVFCIGIYNEKDERLDFKGAKEKGDTLPPYHYDLADSTRIAVWCFKNQKEVFINDYQTELSNYISKIKPVIVGEPPEAIIYLPLVYNKKKIGVITVQSFEKNAYTTHHMKILQNIAVYSAIALENAHLYENMESEVQIRTEEILKQKKALEKSYQSIDILSEIGRQLTSTLDFETIFNKLHENVSQLMSADCFGVRIYQPKKHIVQYKYEVEKGKRDVAHDISMDDDDNYTVWCIKNKKEIFINDNQKDYKKYTKRIVVPRGEMPHSLLFYPMMLGKRVLGVITVQSFEKNAYTKYHSDILVTLASYTAIALENAGMYERLEEKVKEKATR